MASYNFIPNAVNYVINVSLGYGTRGILERIGPQIVNICTITGECVVKSYSCACNTVSDIDSYAGAMVVYKIVFEYIVQN